MARQDFNTRRLLQEYSALSGNDVETLVRRYQRRAPLDEADRVDMYEDLKEANQQMQQKIEAELQKRVLHNNKVPAAKTSLNLVLLGKTGAGKSSTGNMLIGQQIFKDSSSSTSCTVHIQFHTAVVEGVTINLIDTPGLMDTERSASDIEAEILKVIEKFPDGIDAFLYVYNIADPRFTAEDQQAFYAVSQRLFGTDCTAHCFMVLTHVDSNKDFNGLNDYLTQDTSVFKNLMTQTLKGRVIAVNNFEPSVYGMELQRKSLIKLIQQNVQGRYMSHKFEQFQREMRDLATHRPNVLRPMIQFIQSKVKLHFQLYTESQLKALTNYNHSTFAEDIVAKVNIEYNVKPHQQEALLRVAKDIVREKVDDLVTKAVKERERRARLAAERERIRQEEQYQAERQRQEQERQRAEEAMRRAEEERRLAQQRKQEEAARRQEEELRRLREEANRPLPQVHHRRRRNDCVIS